jgi:hypothetical protein
LPLKNGSVIIRNTEKEHRGKKFRKKNQAISGKILSTEEHLAFIQGLTLFHHHSEHGKKKIRKKFRKQISRQWKILSTEDRLSVHSGLNSIPSSSKLPEIKKESLSRKK